jgi:subtilisin family serine protease
MNVSRSALMRTLVLIVAALAALSLAPPGRDIAPSPSSDAAAAAAQVDPDSVVVRATDAPALDAIAATAAARGFILESRLDDPPAAHFTTPPSMPLPEALGRLLVLPGVVYAEPLYDLAAADVPNDPLYARQRDYLDPVGAPAAWDVEKGRPEIIVAVLDTGIDRQHPDLAGRIWTNPREIAANGVDDDVNGCIDDVNGCAFADIVGPSCAPAVNGSVDDDIGHGTFVAGIVAANGNNGAGMVGVARGATVLPVKILDCEGRGNSLALAQAIVYATRAGARVINVSLGGAGDSLLVREAVRGASDDAGVLIVAATGNTGGADVSYPARYEQVLAVGAASLEIPTARADFSSHGPEVDVVAIGEQIVGTVPQGACPRFLPCAGTGTAAQRYAVGDGTSFAAPQVAGLAALVISRNPGLTARAVHDRIKAAADPLPAGDRPDWAGAGRINMLRALEAQYRLGAPGVAKN